MRREATGVESHVTCSCCNENALPHQIERQRNYISISCAQKSCGHVQSIVSSIIFHQPFLRAFKICPRVELTGLQLICSKIHQFEVYSQRQFFHPWMIFDSECGCHHALGPWKHSMLDAILLLVSVSLFTGKKMLNFEDCFWIFWEISIVFLRCPCWRGCCRPVVQCGGAWTLTSVSHWYSDNVVCQIGRCIEESLAFPMYLKGRVNEFFEVPEDLKWFNKGPPEGRDAGMHLFQGVEWFINFLQLSWGQWSHWGTRSGHRLRDFLTEEPLRGYDIFLPNIWAVSSFIFPKSLVSFRSIEQITQSLRDQWVCC